jgi:hypothetical protein
LDIPLPKGWNKAAVSADFMVGIASNTKLHVDIHQHRVCCTDLYNPIHSRVRIIGQSAFIHP